MKCPSCRKGLAIVNCKGCKALLCSGCIQMEVHACPGLESAKQHELYLLKKRMVKVVAPKI